MSNTKYGAYAPAALLAILLAATALPASAQPSVPAAKVLPKVSIGATDIGGVVTSANGPEAGVWGIAETTDLPTKFAKIVVTDDAGRYVIPALPKANYKIWLRGYGLVDSPRVDGAPGKPLNLTATIAPTPADAAKYYPGMYWYSMLSIPGADQFPGTGENGNGIPSFLKKLGAWIESVTWSQNNTHSPLRWRAARPAVWINEVSLRRKPSLSASRMHTSDTSGRSRPSRSRLIPTNTSTVAARSWRRISTRSTASMSAWM